MCAGFAKIGQKAIARFDQGLPVALLDGHRTTFKIRQSINIAGICLAIPFCPFIGKRGKMKIIEFVLAKRIRCRMGKEMIAAFGGECSCKTKRTHMIFPE